MVSRNLNLGGETERAHYLPRFHKLPVTALLARSKFCNHAYDRSPLSKLKKCLKNIRKRSATFVVKSKAADRRTARSGETARGSRARAGRERRVLLRYSGTESKIRLFDRGPLSSIRSTNTPIASRTQFKARSAQTKNMNLARIIEALLFSAPKTVINQRDCRCAP